MTNEQKERAIEMFKMRLDGATYQAIADKYGISKQRVEQLLGRSKAAELDLNFVVYKGLREWMLKNHIRVYTLDKILSKKRQVADANRN